MNDKSAAANPVDVKAFWQTLGERAIGMTVVTASDENGPAGFLGLSATHVTADPPTMLVSIDRKTSALSAVLSSGHFAISFLDADASDTADAFSGKAGVSGSERFRGGDWTTLVTGAPVHVRALGAFDCRVEKVIEHGEIAIVIGAVVGAHAAGKGAAIDLFPWQNDGGMTMNTVNLATVTEADADAQTAAIFADIRDTMGVALVNLIWRHLAVSPAALNWAWQRMKPIYANGAVPEAAWALRQSLDYPELSAFTVEDRHALGSEVGDLPLIDAVLRTYERGNAQNLVALCALRLALRPNLKATGSSSAASPAETLHDAQAEQADRVTDTLPPLPAMADLHATLRADIESLTDVWVPAQHRGMVPSVFRHLAHWPALLAAYRNKLQTVAGETDLVAELADRSIHAATRLASPLVDQLGAVPALDAKTHDWLARALDLFIDGMIGRGVVIVPAMRKVLPQSDSATKDR